ncbi:MAG TPA: nif-specific transcriptional activator NifA [Pseudomonadales bacterium]|nr:nif-specific transcriptional activator NifA [Pseudomonadales bacterium]
MNIPTSLSARPRPLGRAELLEKEMSALNTISRILGRSKHIKETFTQILELIHNDVGLLHGLISFSDIERTKLQISVVHSQSESVSKNSSTVRYKSGEGVIGRILHHGQSIVLPRISSEPRFLDRLALYDFELPFIGVPIKDSDGLTLGVLAAQPNSPADDLLPERTRFMETVANFLAQTVKLLVYEETGDQLRDERDALQREVRGRYGFENMVVGNTPAMRKVFDQVRRVAKWDSTVLILGESGTGKELIASAIHYNSPRSKNNLIRLNCAALPETLLESELFGHEKGAFTGAVKQRKGRFEQADGGTLFLDEIGEISPMFQAKLLRVLQEGEFERVGGSQTVKVNIRVVAATNRDLVYEVEKGKFREDLYYRLNVMAIHIPPLRERISDIPELTEFLLGKIAKRQGRTLSATGNALRLLTSYPWPGNVRELENCLERASIMSESGIIDTDDITLSGVEIESSRPSSPLISNVNTDDNDLDERGRVMAALEQAGWVQAKAARLLNMTPRQIAYRIQILSIPMRKI